jgi:peptidoglycan hydrolase-like protein with peptidoglycan-binding domain
MATPAAQDQAAKQKPELQSSRSLVRDAQQALKSQGYYDGAVDGVMGQQTRDAVRNFQIAHRLPVTGQLDEATVKQLGVKLEEERPPEGGKNVFSTAGSAVKTGAVTAAEATAKGATVAGKATAKGATVAGKATAKAGTVAAKETAESPVGQATAKGATATAKATAKGASKTAGAIKGVFSKKKAP